MDTYQLYSNTVGNRLSVADQVLEIQPVKRYSIRTLASQLLRAQKEHHLADTLVGQARSRLTSHSQSSTTIQIEFAFATLPKQSSDETLAGVLRYIMCTMIKQSGFPPFRHPSNSYQNSKFSSVGLLHQFNQEKQCLDNP